MSTKRSLFRRSLIWIGLTCALAAGPGAAMADAGSYENTGFGGLAAALERHGWSTSTDADGSLLVQRASVGSAAEATGHSPAIARNQNRHRSQHRSQVPDRLALLGEGLQLHGWGVERGADGSLSLYPPVSGPAETASEVAATPAANSDESRLTDALAQRGWDLRRDAAGNVLLIPTV